MKTTSPSMAAREDPAAAARPPAVALVGKGLVYDTGGLNLKTSGRSRAAGCEVTFSFEDSRSFGIAIGEFSMQSGAACRKSVKATGLAQKFQVGPIF